MREVCDKVRKICIENHLKIKRCTTFYSDNGNSMQHIFIFISDYTLKY